MERFSTPRIIFTACSALVATAALVLGIIFAVNGTPLFTPMFVIFAAVLLYGVLYVIAHRKDNKALSDVAISFELIALCLILLICLPLTLILSVVELIQEAAADKRAKKELNTSNE